MTEHVRLMSHDSVLLAETVQEGNRHTMRAEMQLALSEALAQVASLRPPRLGEDTLDLLNMLGLGHGGTTEMHARNVIYSPTKEHS